MMLESYIKKHWRHQSDKQMATIFSVSKDTVARIRTGMGFVRTSSANRDLHHLTVQERADWYKGPFDPHETEWAFSGLTR